MQCVTRHTPRLELGAGHGHGVRRFSTRNDRALQEFRTHVQGSEPLRKQASLGNVHTGDNEPRQLLLQERRIANLVEGGDLYGVRRGRI